MSNKKRVFAKYERGKRSKAVQTGINKEELKNTPVIIQKAGVLSKSKFGIPLNILMKYIIL